MRAHREEVKCMESKIFILFSLICGHSFKDSALFISYWLIFTKIAFRSCVCLFVVCLFSQAQNYIICNYSHKHTGSLQSQHVHGEKVVGSFCFVKFLWLTGGAL